MDIKFIDITRTELRDIKYPAYCQLKLDGELVAWDGYNGKLWNSYGNEKTRIDTTDFPKNCILYGELYYGDGRDFYNYLRHQFSPELKVAFFDVLSYDHKEMYGVEPYEARFKVLFSLPVDIPDTTEVGTQSDVESIYKEVVDNGYEGVVVKPSNSLTCGAWVKHKREYYDKLLVVGKKKDKNSLLIGTPDHIYGAVSTIGWDSPIKKAFAREDISVKSEDKEAHYFDSRVVLNVKHNGYIRARESDTCVSLRNPCIVGICEDGSCLTLPRA